MVWKIIAVSGFEKNGKGLQIQGKWFGKCGKELVVRITRIHLQGKVAPLGAIV